jgi:hypothetical protein
MKKIDFYPHSSKATSRNHTCFIMKQDTVGSPQLQSTVLTTLAFGVFFFFLRYWVLKKGWFGG